MLSIGFCVNNWAKDIFTFYSLIHIDLIWILLSFSFHFPWSQSDHIKRLRLHHWNKQYLWLLCKIINLKWLQMSPVVVASLFCWRPSQWKERLPSCRTTRWAESWWSTRGRSNRSDTSTEESTKQKKGPASLPIRSEKANSKLYQNLIWAVLVLRKTSVFKTVWIFNRPLKEESFILKLILICLGIYQPTSID